MHVAIDARLATDGGIGTHLRNVIPRLVAARPGWRFTLFGRPDALQTLDWARHDRVTVQPCTAGLYSLREQVELTLRCPSDADVFWSPHYNAPVLSRRPTVVTVHDVCHLAVPDAVDSAAKRAYAAFMFGHVRDRASAVLFVSSFSRDEMQRLVGTPKGLSALTPNACDGSWAAATNGNGARPLAEPYLVYVGNWKRHKNVPLLLRAFARAADAIPHRLVLVGRQSGLNADPGIAAEVERLGARVHVAGEVSDDDVRRWIAHADALVTASRYEGFGLPPLEAMAAGRPCVVSRAGALPEVCGDAALYCDPLDEASVESALRRIATDEPLRDRLTTLGRERVRAFSWDQTVSTVADTLERVAR